ncbi:MAG: hypothetical protein FJZ12_02250 [Candidatus Omnitrophica bacterium]|nr:hypothetical protein [Candidatus Omnitrophota bacterium]
MRIERLLNKGVSTLEYIAIIMIICSALVAMSLYYRRALQGKYRQAADVLGLQEQYTPPPRE